MFRTRWLEAVRQLLNQASERGRRRGRRERCRPSFRPYLEALELRLAPAITLSIANPAPFPEGDSGTTNMLFVVTRFGESAPALTVDYATQDGTAHAGIDYQAQSGTLSFAPGQTTATISVPIIGNLLVQANRSFTVALSNPLASAAF